ncbi:uncharacterized protein EI97DRAFT_441362 [Westerdykella ornata]|uniref:Uncharacterized protein n=1 Tax=Westerdykella ornata TaxID=318751 RepID=A0A6A6JMY3_WESOR|nr:uncharacterized protein EI97DRAFT_441362 [Westerdykella ornata]KAF2277288.1 hypothetical protein EI97DRAFT_441362 [Westerdykella ornata]
MYHCPEGSTDYEFEPYFYMGFSPTPTTVIETAPPSTMSASCCSSVYESFWDGQDNCPSINTSLSSQTDHAFEEVNDYGENWLSPWTAESEPTIFSQSEDTEHDSLNLHSISSGDLQLKDYSLSYPGMLPSLCIDPRETIDPMILSLDINSIDNSREIPLASRAKSLFQLTMEMALNVKALTRGYYPSSSITRTFRYSIRSRG